MRYVEPTHPNRYFSHKTFDCHRGSTSVDSGVSAVQGMCNGCTRWVNIGEYARYSVNNMYCFHCDSILKARVIQESVEAWKKYKRLKRLEEIASKSYIRN